MKTILNPKKSVVIFFVLVVMMTLSISAFAKDNKIKLNIPANLGQTVCKQRPWQGVKGAWLGVKDERQSTELIVVEKVKVDPIVMELEPSVIQYFDQHLKDVFEACGVEWVSASQADYRFTALLYDFAIYSNRKTFKSTSDAESRMAINVASDSADADVNVTYSIESKTASFQNKKRIAKDLTELLIGTIEQLVYNHELDFIAKK